MGLGLFSTEVTVGWCAGVHTQGLPSVKHVLYHLSSSSQLSVSSFATYEAGFFFQDLLLIVYIIHAFLQDGVIESHGHYLDFFNISIKNTATTKSKTIPHVLGL